MDGRYDAVAEALEQTLINADESIRQIEDASSSISLSQNEIDDIEQRLFALRAAARKHQVTIDELPAVLERMRQQLDRIELGGRFERLSEKEQQRRLEYIAAAESLSEKRRQAAAALDWKVMEELPPLKMEKARFCDTGGTAGGKRLERERY